MLRSPIGWLRCCSGTGHLKSTSTVSVCWAPRNAPPVEQRSTTRATWPSTVRSEMKRGPESRQYWVVHLHPRMSTSSCAVEALRPTAVEDHSLT